MVALLEASVVVPQGGVVEQGKLLLEAVELLESILLEFVAQPGGRVALLVGPGNGLGHGDLADGLELGGGLCGRHEFEVLLAGHGAGQCAHELEDAAFGSLMLAEGLVVHEEVDDVALGGLEPAHEFLRGERPLVPAPVGEAEGDVVAERIVAQQDLQIGVEVVVVDIVRALPAHDVAGALGQHRIEAEFVDHRADVVGIDQLGVAEGRGRESEILLHGRLVLLHLVDELRLGDQGGQGMVVCLAEELHVAGLGQLAEALDDFGGVAVELLQDRTGDGEGQLELALALGDRLEQQIVHRQVALLCDALEDRAVGEIIIIVGVFADIEKSVKAQAGRLMDLEIQADGLLHTIC